MDLNLSTAAQRLPTNQFGFDQRPIDRAVLRDWDRIYDTSARHGNFYGSGQDDEDAYYEFFDTEPSVIRAWLVWWIEHTRGFAAALARQAARSSLATRVQAALSENPLGGGLRVNSGQSVADVHPGGRKACPVREFEIATPRRARIG